MKSQTMFKNAYADETIYKTDTATSNFANTEQYNWHGGTKTILVNAAMVNTSYIRLPEATTSNAGLHVRVIIGIAPADNMYVGFVTSLIAGGATTFSDGAVGLMTANTGFVASAVGTSNLRVVLDVDGSADDGGGAAGSVLDFWYTGVANVVIYRGSLIGTVDSATLANHFSTTAVNA